jgi:SAM-dependent methyltransferase
MGELTTKEYWGCIWKGHEPHKIEKNCNFFDLLRKYLPSDPKMKCLEVGCTPGRFLVAFNKNFGYKVYGVDQCGIETTRKNLEFNGINDYELHQSDFLKWKTDKKFDVVSSFGYLEHFEDPSRHIKKMVGLMPEDSYLVVEIPNFRYLNYMIRSVFRRDVDWKETHNLKIMDLDFFRKIIREFELEPVYLGYYRFFSYWHKNRNPFLDLLSAPIRAVSFILGKVTDILDLNTALANRYTSPFMIFIAKKK